MLTVYAPGTEVDLGEDLTGIVNQVMISGKDRVQYQVVWWVGNERKCEWLDAHEVLPLMESKLKIGFWKNSEKC